MTRLIENFAVCLHSFTTVEQQNDLLSLRFSLVCFAAFVVKNECKTAREKQRNSLKEISLI
jgi:hypothetical protein